MKKMFLFVALIGLMTWTSCSLGDPCGGDKSQFLDNYNAFMQEVDDLDLDHNDEAWKEYDDRFKKMVEECYEIHEGEMSLREERKFWAKTVTYYVQRYGNGFADVLKNDNSELNLSIKEHMKDAKGDIRIALNDLEINLSAQEVEDMFDELGSDLEKLGKKWGKKLENLIEKNK